MIFDDRIDIDVRPVLPNEIKRPNTVHYSMTKKPRGKAFVINNAFDLVEREAQRFVHIFNELVFEAEDHYGMTANQMIEKFTKLSKDMLERYEEHNERDEALIIMVITHGEDEKLLGINHPSCGGTDDTDWVPFQKIVDLFANNDNTLKIFFFNCFREKNDRNPQKNCYLKNGSDTNTDSYVYYSCAEGYEPPAHPYYTPYGRALSESLAEFAHNEDLVQIVKRANQSFRANYMNISRDLGEIETELNKKSTSHKLYFNPGWFEGQ